MFQFTATDGISADLASLTKKIASEQKQVGRQVVTVARKALLADVRATRKGGLSFKGMRAKLGAKTRVTATASSATAYLDAAPAGAWAISEKGRSAVKPTRKKALTINGGFAMSAKPTTGTPRWYAAAPAIDRAVLPVIEDAYDKILSE